MENTVTVKCWKCGGTGRFVGVCWGCDGSGTNTYPAAAWARKVAAAKGRRTAQQRRNEAAQAARNAELAAMTFDQLVEWVHESANVGHDGLLEDWVPGSDIETERITPEEKARRIIAER